MNGMKIKHYNIFITVLILILVSNGCKKFDTKPLVVTSEVINIGDTQATCGGRIISAGDAEILSKGVCWSTNSNPTIDNNNTSDGSGYATFASNLRGLLPNTTYYVRAYATNTDGVGYGEIKSFKTAISDSKIFTKDVINITNNGAISGGNIVADGGAPITSRGVCWSKTINPTISDNKTSDGGGLGIFSSNITGLQFNTTYYVRAYAINMKGTFYGDQKVFTTQGNLPVLSTNSVSDIKSTNAKSGGTISFDGGSPITARGICWSSTNVNPTIIDSKTSDGTGLGIFNSSITDLKANTKYYIRAYASNANGISYGDPKIFTTLPYAIGDTCLGGVIAYILQPSDQGYDPIVTHGLIISLDANNLKKWSGGSCSSALWGTFSNIGAGPSNTNIIVAKSCILIDDAASFCDKLVVGAYSDWYLPSELELYAILKNSKIINLQYGQSIRYWSSTQYSLGGITGARSVSYHNMINGNYNTYSTLSLYSDLNRVLAVRSF